MERGQECVVVRGMGGERMGEGAKRGDKGECGVLGWRDVLLSRK